MVLSAPVFGPGLSSTSPAKIRRMVNNKMSDIVGLDLFSADILDWSNNLRLPPVLFPLEHVHLQQLHRPILALH